MERVEDDGVGSRRGHHRSTPRGAPGRAGVFWIGRRGPRRAIVVAVILLVGLLTAAGAWLVNAEPLGTGSFGFGVADSLHATYSDIDALGVSGRVIRIPAAPGLVFRYRFTVANAGSLPVTITDAGSRAQPSAVSTSVVAMKPNMSVGGAVAEGFVPFHPLQLGPGQQAGLEMEVRLADDYCSAPGTFLSWYQEPISFRLLGINRQADVETGTEIELTGNASTSC
jgi:hypothetical protein